jgi:hypothetical protein
MLKISAGNEEFGLCGKWLLHGFKIAKLNLQGNPRLMQRSHYYQPSVSLILRTKVHIAPSVMN